MEPWSGSAWLQISVHVRQKHESPRARIWKVWECGEAHGSTQGLGIGVHARSVANHGITTNS